ncbi:MAG TPA: NADPH:quinone reductase [Methylomirabilota bacterium]|nr:NADPH:quinone reductase [Methylomirabilota bacterium]
MKAAYINSPGEPEQIIYGDLPTPDPAPGQCLVRVGAVAVNPIDTYIRGGIIPAQLPKPFVLGCDLAGEVAAVGAGVTRFKVGDRVWGSNQGLLGRQGTFAEFAAVDEQWLYPTPASVSDESAAAIALVGITAHLGLFSRARLQKGETLFVNGGAGGVGSTVVQMVKAAGARVITTAGTPEKVQLAQQLGADVAINYASEDVVARVKQAAPEGVHVFWETLREPNFDQAVALLAQNGRMVLMAGREARPQFPVGPFYVKGCSLHGFVMFMAPADEQRRAAEDINQWLASGAIKPRIDRVLPLSETAAAHRLQQDSTVKRTGALAGKLVLRP